MAQRNNEKERQGGSNRFRSFAPSQKGAFRGNRNSDRAITGERISPLNKLDQVAQLKLDRTFALLVDKFTTHNLQFAWANANEADQLIALNEAKRQWAGDNSRNFNIDPRIASLVMLILIFWVSLTSCASPSQSPDITPSATQTSESTAASTETPVPATETAIPTATETLSPAESYVRVGIENYSENQLTMEDLAPGGKVDQFFESVTLEILAGIDWDKIDADDVEYATVAGAFSPRPDFDNDKPRYANPDANAFDREWNAFGEIVVGENRYIFMPVILYDTDEHTIHFVKAAFPLQRDGMPLSQEQIQQLIKIWKEKMNVTPLDFGAIPDFASQVDPLFLQHLDPDTQELINSILKPIVVNVSRDGDLISTIDQIKHIIWMVRIGDVIDGSWYE